MEDFGSPLPFKYVHVPNDYSYLAYYMRLHCEKAVTCGGTPVLYPEQWAYFLWLPRSSKTPRLKAPDRWGIVEDIPHEYLYVEIRNAPVYFIPWHDDSVTLVLVDFLLEHGGCADWLVRELHLLRARVGPAPVGLNAPFERFVRRCVRTW